MEISKDIVELRQKKIEDIKQGGIRLFPNDFKASDTIQEINAWAGTQPDDAGGDPSASDNTQAFQTAGRMMAINKMGKSSFIRFRDRTGQLQAYIRADKVGEEAYSLFKKLDVGDFIGVSGKMFKTRTGEWTLLADQMTLISKSMRPLPEKFHGLKDPEKRYRQRYLDLVMNQDVREIFVKRTRMIQAVRSFLLNRDFLEVETPMMQPVAGGAEATPFVTHHNALDMNLFLRIAPELYLKRLLVGGFDRVFEINRNFRNEGVSTRHNPEFTMIEFYQAYATYEDLMVLTEELFREVSMAVNGSPVITYDGEEIDFSGKWNRMPLLTSLSEIGGLDPGLFGNREGLIEFAVKKGVTLTKTERIGKILTKLFDALVEPKLIQPTFITGYPVEVSPLSRKNDENPELTDRFELFIAGREIANGFSEINDPVDQKQRFLQQMEDREAGDKEAHQMDSDYIEALEYGMPPAAGEGIGIDRMIMLFTGAMSIREVILFPLMKPQKS
ncbi:MAG: lysine--tRNA ligase [Proteobacteria bacterium]|nr:lysine--tRNA ligase [Pseudomonadota bacterium]